MPRHFFSKRQFSNAMSLLGNGYLLNNLTENFIRLAETRFHATNDFHLPMKYPYIKIRCKKLSERHFEVPAVRLENRARAGVPKSREPTNSSELNFSKRALC